MSDHLVDAIKYAMTVLHDLDTVPDDAWHEEELVRWMDTFPLFMDGSRIPNRYAPGPESLHLACRQNRQRPTTIMSVQHNSWATPRLIS